MHGTSRGKATTVVGGSNPKTRDKGPAHGLGTAKANCPCGLGDTVTVIEHRLGML